MAWEWVAPVVTGVVGVVSVTGTLAAARVAATTARDVAGITTRTQVAVSRDEKRVDALQAALALVNLITVTVDQFGRGKARPNDLEMPAQQFHQVYAGLLQWGGEDVLKAFNDWQDAFAALPSDPQSLKAAAAQQAPILRERQSELVSAIRSHISQLPEAPKHARE